MSLKTEGVTCTRCHAYLFDDDDIVYCPVCGAPHHRDCYNELGHCALEELHGTEKQYDKIKDIAEGALAQEIKNVHNGENAEGKITCQMCHESYDFSLNTCPKCGAPNIAKAGGSFVSFDFLGGVPADCDIGEGVTAEEAKRLVAANTPRYIPKFTILNKNNRTSWNWMAFLFPCGWMLSRKMYKNGVITGLLTVIASLLYLPFSNAIYNLGFTENETYADLMGSVLTNISDIGAAVMLFAALGFILNLAIRFVSAIFGDYLYKSYTVATVKKIRAESEDLDYDYRKKGGVNIFLFLIGVMAVQYLPAIIAMFV
ncbi:MAG: RING finger protein [Acutalibacteraceae bacterium]|nr:RING finger protein [Acutalibacteraceae bacterium]